MNTQDLLAYIALLINSFNMTTFSQSMKDFEIKQAFYSKMDTLIFKLEQQGEHYLFLFDENDKMYLQKDNLGYLDEEEEKGEDFVYCETEYSNI